MDEKKMVTLDLTDCKYLGELHERIRKAFDFPEWYGENWDAFWDLLFSDCDADGVRIIGEHTLSKEFDSQIEILHTILEENKEKHSKYHHDFSIEIERQSRPMSI